MRRPWTMPELRRLRRLYPTTPPAALAAMFDRPAAAIRSAAQRLRLRKSPDYVSPSHAAIAERGAATRFGARQA